MVVDDEEDILQSTAMLLELLGYEPVLVSDPGEVLMAARQHQPGLILQDLRMPGINVAGLVASLRSDAGTAEIPIVFFSAHTDVATSAGRYDVWGFLRKPFAPHALQRILDQVFKGATAAPRDAQRAVKDAFHAHWNIMASMANYAHILKCGPDASGSVAGNAIEDLLLRLEATTDRLHGLVSSLAAEPLVEIADDADRPPRPSRRRPERVAERSPDRR